jgi:hypothetical protein
MRRIVRCGLCTLTVRKDSENERAGKMKGGCKETSSVGWANVMDRSNALICEQENSR